MTDEAPTLYQVLGVPHDAQPTTIRSAYRKLAAKYHPDNQDTGDEETFNRVKEAYDILIDEEKRQRYDRTGRTDKQRVTPQAIQETIREWLKVVLTDARRYRGNPAVLSWEWIINQVKPKIAGSRETLVVSLRQAEADLAKVTAFRRRFMKTAGEKDYIGEILDEEIKQAQDRVNLAEDAILLSREAERSLLTYDYEVSPDSEGQGEPGLTALLHGGPRRLGRNHYNPDKGFAVQG